jgi:aldose sugar dehydrogenase
MIKYAAPTLIILTAAAIVSLAASDQSARELYIQHCATCHGQDLQGGMAQGLVDGKWQFGAERGYIFRNIQFGIPNFGMPGYNDVLSRGQINELTDFILNAEKAAGAQKPAIPETTQTLDYTLKVETWVEGLDVPWGLVFADETTALVTERAGRLRQIKDGKLLAEPVKATPEVLAEGQGGLLDVAVDPDYAENRWVYLSYSHALPGSEAKPVPAMTRIVRGRIKDNTWTDQQVVWEAPRETYLPTRIHYGCRIVFDRKGFLYFGIGDRSIKEHAQDLSRPNGKIHRIKRDGTIPATNPFLDRPDALPSIFAYGIRNPQGLSVHPETDQLWEAEHGPLGGDEVNLIRAGLNYGWPVITYGRDYTGEVISPLEAKPGMEQPIYYWTPAIALCAAEFYTGDLFAKWKNHLLVTALKYEEVRLLDIKENRVLFDEVILKNPGRVRDVAVGPDGAIYPVLNSPGTILRLTP